MLEVVRAFVAKMRSGLLPVVLLVALVAVSAPATAETGLGDGPVGYQLAVIYPKVREPFASIYRDFITGIQGDFSGIVEQLQINGTLRHQISRRDQDQSPHVYVALGNNSLGLLLDIPVEKPIVAALTNRRSEGAVTGGVYLRPGAAVYLSKLLEVHPEVAAVYTVYNPDKHGELIEEGEALLAEHGIELKSVPARSLREAAQGYRRVLDQAERGSALWLMADGGLIDGSLLSMILSVAWNKHLAVFSSNPQFVKHGALFAIYPDNVGIGQRLGRIAENVARGDHDNAGLEPLQDVKIAYNERTGDHIGIKLPPKFRAGIDLLMPTP